MVAFHDPVITFVGKGACGRKGNLFVFSLLGEHRPMKWQVNAGRPGNYYGRFLFGHRLATAASTRRCCEAKPVFQLRSSLACVNVSGSQAGRAFLFRGALTVLPFVPDLAAAPFHAALTDTGNDLFPLTGGACLFGFLGHVRASLLCYSAISFADKKSHDVFIIPYVFLFIFPTEQCGNFS
jgi:hypothetical protein